MQSPKIIRGANPAFIVQATHKLTDNFDAFFGNINPSATWRARAASQYNSLKNLLENEPFLKANLCIECRTQGSYDRFTAIHSINDLDMVAFCTGLRYPPGLSLFPSTNPGWTRDRIFHAIEAVLANDGRYRQSLQWSNSNSMCVKLDLGIKVEILPVVPQLSALELTGEPFFLWRPSAQAWELGYAQTHQEKLSEKNASACQVIFDSGQNIGVGTDGNFIPAIKVLKHLCSIFGVGAVSFHLECLLFSLPCEVFWGGPCSFIAQTLFYIASQDPIKWYGQRLMTPCGDRDIFTASEWRMDDWLRFHAYCSVWKDRAMQAIAAYSRGQAIECWQGLLGPGWFPSAPTVRR